MIRYYVKNNLNLKKKPQVLLFLFTQIKNYLPRSYLENYKIFIQIHRKIFKKRLFIGSYSVQFFDRYKTFFG